MSKPRFIAEQGRRPSGLLGQVVARVMAKETAPENAYLLDLLEPNSTDAVLELGSGHGDTLAAAARRSVGGQFEGVDFSPLMHRLSKRRHRSLVAQGRLSFRLGRTDQLPFGAAEFDKVFTVHTIYFWDTPLDHLREVHRVLRPGGSFILGFRPAEDRRFVETFKGDVYRIRPLMEVADLVRAAGFELSRTLPVTVAGRQMAYIVANRRAPGVGQVSIERGAGHSS